MATTSEVLPFEDVEENIVSQVRNFKRKWGLDFDDLYSAAMEGYLKACKSFDGGKGASFTTWLWRCCQNEMTYVARRAKTRRKYFVALGDWKESARGPASSLPEHAMRLQELFSKMSPDGRAVALRAMELPDSFCRARQKAKTILYRSFGRWGWSKERIDKAFAEVSEALSSVY